MLKVGFRYIGLRVLYSLTLLTLKAQATPISPFTPEALIETSYVASHDMDSKGTLYFIVNDDPSSDSAVNRYDKQANKEVRIDCTPAEDLMNILDLQLFEKRKFIVYLAVYSNGNEVYMTGLNGENCRRLTQPRPKKGEKNLDLDYKVSPDGHWLLWVTTVNNHTYTLSATDLTTLQTTTLRSDLEIQFGEFNITFNKQNTRAAFVYSEFSTKNSKSITIDLHNNLAMRNASVSDLIPARSRGMAFDENDALYFCATNSSQTQFYQWPLSAAEPKLVHVSVGSCFDAKLIDSQRMVIKIENDVGVWKIGGEKLFTVSTKDPFYGLHVPATPWDKNKTVIIESSAGPTQHSDYRYPVLVDLKTGTRVVPSADDRKIFFFKDEDLYKTLSGPFYGTSKDVAYFLFIPTKYPNVPGNLYAFNLITGELKPINKISLGYPELFQNNPDRNELLMTSLVEEGRSLISRLQLQ